VRQASGEDTLDLAIGRGLNNGGGRGGREFGEERVENYKTIIYIS
jgi:hypothetical protein